MRFFFADDSVQKTARSGMGTSVVSFGGVLIAGSQLRSLAADLNGIAAAYGLPHDEEIKWSPRKGSWIHENLRDQQRLECYSAILQSAVDHGCQAVVAVLDYEMRNLKPEWAFERAVNYALERISTQLAGAKEEAVIVADRPSGGHKESDKFVASFEERLASEHNHMLADTFAMNMLTAPSHMVRHLQLADLVVSITTAMVAGQVKYAGNYFDIVRNMLLRNSAGCIGGCGVKIYPDSLVNLYHWVLGDDHLVRGNTGWPLPHAKILFSTNDGISS